MTVFPESLLEYNICIYFQKTNKTNLSDTKWSKWWGATPYCPLMEMPINLINHTELLVLKIPSTCWVMPWHFSMQPTLSWSRCHSVRQFWGLLNIDNCDACQIDHILEPMKILVVWRQFDLLVQWSSLEHASGLTGRSSQGGSRDLFHNCLSHTYERTDISAAIMKNCFRSYQNKSPCSSSEIGIYELGVDH